MKKTICYHHNDSDGKLAAGVVASTVQGGDIELRKINYNDAYSFEGLKDKRVIVVDFSFPDMLELESKCKELIWIDHHETAKKQGLAWANQNIKGKREIGKCGALLAFKYFYPHELIPRCIKLVNDYDLWIKKMPDSDAFNERISLVEFIGFFNEMVQERDTRPNVVNKLIEEGKILLQQKHLRALSSIEKGIARKLWTNPAQTSSIENAFWVNSSPMDTSHTGAEILKKGYDIAILYFHDKHDVIFSLRSNKYDCSQIAECYGGGGHKHAAGFHIATKKLNTI